MCQDIVNALVAWADDDSVELVIVDHAEATRGFCAGGDLVLLADSGASYGDEARRFFETEYRLINLIARYPKPYVAIMDGLVMGGGAGISINGTYQVATERTVFAMPETGVGLFPDVSATWFLPRLQGELGTWIALTGARIKGTDVAAIGLATHYCEAQNLTELKVALSQNGICALADYHTNSAFSLKHLQQSIDRLFEGDCATAILSRLEAGNDWANNQAVKLRAKSPLSTKIALRQLRTGPFLDSVSDALRIEYRIASRLVCSANFKEGVRAVLIDKDHCPNWRPSKLQSVTYDHVSKYFTPMPGRELTFLRETNCTKLR